MRAHGTSSSPFHAAWVMPLVSIASLTAVAGPGSAAADLCRNEMNMGPRPSAGVATHWRRMRSARMIPYLHGGSVCVWGSSSKHTQQRTAVGAGRCWRAVSLGTCPSSAGRLPPENSVMCGRPQHCRPVWSAARAAPQSLPPHALGRVSSASSGVRTVLLGVRGAAVRPA